MGRPATKTDLMRAAEEGYENLSAVISSLTEEELSVPFAFDDKKKEAHWKRDKNLRDVLVHLYEWHQLLLVWVRANQSGECRPFLPEPYNWRTYGEMNVEFWKKHQDTALENAKQMLAESHREVLALAETFSNDELFSRTAFAWCKGNALGSYFVSSTSSHYNWAVKKLKAHKKIVRIR